MRGSLPRNGIMEELGEGELESGTRRLRALWWMAPLVILIGLFPAGVFSSEAPAPGGGQSATNGRDAEDGAEPVWHVEEETGARYRLHAIPKILAPFKRLDGGRVAFQGGGVFVIADEDEEQFFVKIYKDPRSGEGADRAETPGADEVAATYAVDVQEVDRLVLEPFDSGLPERGQWRNSFDVADMNGDGNLDIVFGPARKGSPRPNIFLGNGQGEWKPVPADAFPSGPYDYGAAVAADFNGDGRLDLALAMHLLGSRVLVSEPDGSFSPWSEGMDLRRQGGGNDGTPFTARALTVTDWNADSRPDLLLIGEGPQSPGRGAVEGAVPELPSSRGLRLYLNGGDGTWSTRAIATDGLQRGNFADCLVADDLDGDGDVDLVTGTRQLGNRWMTGFREGDRMVFRELEQLRPRGIILGVSSADLDRDGWLDLVVAYQSNEYVWRTGIDLLWGGENGWTRQGLVARETTQGMSTVAVGDVDGDGHLDIAGVDRSAELFLFLGDGDRGFLRETSGAGELPPLSAGCTGFQVRLDDLNGDGRDEILVAFAGEPSGFPGAPEVSEPGCPGAGSLRVWSPASGFRAEDS